MTTGEPAVVDPFDTLGAVGNRNGSLVDLVTEQIEALIRAGRLRTGDQLPPERELCRQFGVSRTVVREAVARLSAKNLLEVRGGATGGIVVRAPTAEQVSDSLRFLINSSEATINPDKVLEVRRLLEVEMAGLAAARRTELDLVRLEAIMVESETVGARPRALCRQRCGLPHGAGRGHPKRVVRGAARIHERRSAFVAPVGVQHARQPRPRPPPPHCHPRPGQGREGRRRAGCHACPSDGSRGNNSIGLGA